MRIVDLQIENVAFGGKGVARELGKAVFIPFTIDGELVSAKIIREKKQFAEAAVVDLRKTSPHRIDPPCQYFGQCGGCAYQHMDYAHQLEIKSRQVRDVLQRIGKVKDLPLRPIIPSPLQYGYRNRITVHAEAGVIGYFRRDSHRLIDIERCPIAMEEVNCKLTELRLQRVRDGHHTLRAEVDRPLTGRSPTRSEDGVGGSRTTSTGQPERVSSSGSERINAFHHFSQTNDAVANMLRDLIVGLIPAGQDLLIDAYCGAGFFAKALVDKFKRLVGIDWDRFAIASAQETATPKENYIIGDIEHELRPVNLNAISIQVSGDEQDTRSKMTLIVDPPATGLSVQAREAIVDLAPGTFIYVSCNPSTLARDLKDFSKRFKLESITPLDMFPQTAEIEVVAHLKRFNESTI